MGDVRLEHVFKAYEKNEVHKDLSLVIEDGECFTLLGPSGCGKSVMLRMIAGFEAPDKGKIWIGDRLVADPGTQTLVPPEARDLGVVFQEYAVWPHMTVFDNIGYPLKIRKEPKEVIREKVMRVVDLVNLTGLDQRLPSQLSGGQQQRVALGRALVCDPSLMLLDEPLNNLDANLREEMRFEIRELQHKLGITVIYVTHDQEIALAIADRIAIMDASGHVVQIGTPVEVFEEPVDDFVFRFLGVSNFLPVRRKDGGYYSGDAQVHINPVNPPAADDLVAAFRPSDTYLSRQGTGTPGTVLRASYLGPIFDCLVDVGGHPIRTQISTATALANDLVLKEGEKCLVNFHSVKLYDSTTVEQGVSA